MISQKLDDAANAGRAAIIDSLGAAWANDEGSVDKRADAVMSVALLAAFTLHAAKVSPADFSAIVGTFRDQMAAAEE